MHRRILGCILLALVATLPAAAAAAELDALLARTKAAAGGEAWDAITALELQGRLRAGGLEGPVTALESLDGRYRSRYQLGPASGAEGYDGERAWSEGAGGEVQAAESEGDRVATANNAWQAARGWWYPQRKPATLKLAAEAQDGSRRFDVVEAQPQGGRTVKLWFARDSALLERIVDFDGRDTITTRLGDYRHVDGLRLPFAIRTSRGDPKYDTVIAVTGYTVNPTLAADAFTMLQRVLDDYRFAAGTSASVVPFDLVNNHIYVDAEVDGKPVRMLVDTGGINILTPAAAQRLGLGSQGELEIRGVGEHSADLGMARAKSVTVGAVTVDAPLFYTVDLAFLVPVEGVALDGILGYEMFRRFVVQIDYARRRMTLSRLDSVAGDTQGWTEVTFDGGTPTIAGTVDGVAGQFTLDTGSRSSLTLHSPFVAQHRLRASHPAGAERITGWGVGGPSRTLPTRVGTLELGGYRLETIAADLFVGAKGAHASQYLAGNIGGGVLRRFTLTLDYERSRLRLVPNADFAHREHWDRSGLWMNAADGAFEVVEVVADTPAARAGVQAGDRIVALDGKPVARWELAEARLALRERAPDTVVALELERGGARRGVSLELAELVPAAPPAAP